MWQLIIWMLEIRYDGYEKLYENGTVRRVNM